MELRELQWGPAELERLATQLAQPTNASSQPNSSAVAVAVRNVPNLQANSKLIAAYIAELTYNSKNPTKVVGEPPRIGTQGRVCKQSDFSSSWFFHWTDRLKLAPRLHRKIWEDAYVAQCLWERGCLKPGKRGLGFAVGTEALPSLFASCGASIIATDLAADDERSRGWSLNSSTCVKYRGPLEAAANRPRKVFRKLLVRDCQHDRHPVEV